jgi:glycosyltransferase involved in cell wall biosynthesis
MHDPRIFFFTSGHSPFSERLFFRELLSLKKKYRDLSIIAPYTKKNESRQGISVISTRKRRSRYNRFSTLFDLFRNGLKNKPDVLHCHEPDSFLVGLLIRKLLGNGKVVYDCHEFHPLSFTENLPRYLGIPLQKLIRYIEDFMVSRADAVITVNDKLGNRFKKNNRNVTILPNYPPLAIFEKAKRSTRIFSANCVSFIYVGSLSAERGLFKMVDILSVANSFEKCRLTLIGNFTEEKTKRVFWKYAADKNVSDLIDYKGYLPHEEICHQLMKCDIGLCLLDDRLRYQWSEPIKYFEYSAAGLPVVLSNLQAMKNLIDTNNNGCVVSFDSMEEIKDAVKTLLKNKEEAARMGERGQVAFKVKYNWEALETRLFGLYSSLK